MADEKISDLNTVAAADVALTDRFVLDDGSNTEALTFEATRDALGLNGIVRFSTSVVADGAVNNGECYIYLDTTVSPVALTVKAKDGSGNVFTGTI